MSLQDFTDWEKGLLSPDKKILNGSGRELWTFTPAPGTRRAALLTSGARSGPKGKTGG